MRSTRRIMIWILLVMVAFLAIVTYAYQRTQRAVFSAKLRTFELTMTRQGMPGKPARTTIVSSDGTLSYYEVAQGVRTEEAQDSLPESDVTQIRQALGRIWSMEGDYEAPFWNRTTAADFLSIHLELGDGSSRSIWLSGVNPRPTRGLLRTINALVPDQYQIYFVSD